MSKLTKLLLVCFLSGLASTAAAFDGFDLSCLRPYVGIDGGLRTTPYGRNNGGNIFPKDFPYVNGFVGLQLHECVALELGYEYSNQTRNSRVVPGQFATGVAIVGPDNFAEYTSNARFQGFNANLIGRYQIFDCPNIQVLGLIGATYLKARLEQRLIAIDGIDLPEEVREGNIRTFTKNRWIARLGGGLEHMLTDCIGIRGLIIWQNTNQFKHINVRQTVDGDGDPLPPTIFATVKNSMLYSLGIFMRF